MNTEKLIELMAKVAMSKVDIDTKERLIIHFIREATGIPCLKAWEITHDFLIDVGIERRRPQSHEELKLKPYVLQLVARIENSLPWDQVFKLEAQTGRSMTGEESTLSPA